MPHAVRRSQRNLDGGKAAQSHHRSKYEFDQFSDPPVGTKRRGKANGNGGTASQTPISTKHTSEKDEEYVSECEPEEAVTSHPSKNYTKVDLYHRWVRARNEATDNKKDLLELQKESRRNKKEMEKLYKELEKEQGTVEKLENKCDDLFYQIEEEKQKSQSTKKDGKEGKVSNTAIIANMKATFDNLQSKKEFQHKTHVCELQLKYKELEIEYKAKEQQIVWLEEENKDLKKNQCNVNELKVASLKSEIQICSMQDKSLVR